MITIRSGVEFTYEMLIIPAICHGIHSRTFFESFENFICQSCLARKYTSQLLVYNFSRVKASEFLIYSFIYLILEL